MFKSIFIIYILLLQIIFANEITNKDQNKNKNKNINYYKKLSRMGNIDGYFKLGVIYYKGKEAKKDIDKAYYYFKLASDYNHKKAKYNLAVIYSNKKLKYYNPKKGYQLFLELAKQNEPKSQYRVGVALLYGFGVNINYTEALKWLEISYFENRYDRASCAIGFIYANGMGVIQNLGRAKKLTKDLINKYPLCKKVYEDFKLYKNKYNKDRGFKFGYYRN